MIRLDFSRIVIEGKHQIICGKIINEIRQKLRTEQYEGKKKLKVIDSNMTLDEWFEVL